MWHLGLTIWFQMPELVWNKVLMIGQSFLGWWEILRPFQNHITFDNENVQKDGSRDPVRLHHQSVTVMVEVCYLLVLWFGFVFGKLVYNISCHSKRAAFVLKSCLFDGSREKNRGQVGVNSWKVYVTVQQTIPFTLSLPLTWKQNRKMFKWLY